MRMRRLLLSVSVTDVEVSRESPDARLRIENKENAVYSLSIEKLDLDIDASALHSLKTHHIVCI